MLDTISSGFKDAAAKFRGQATLNEDNIKEAVKTIRRSLLEADVEFGVAKEFVGKVEAKALGQKVALKAGKKEEMLRVTASDHFTRICHEELTALMGPESSGLEFAVNRPTTIMMVGLQGTGKTTTTAKLAKYLINRHKKRPLLVAADIYRPAAVDQLKTLGQRLSVPVFHAPGETPQRICDLAVKEAIATGRDVVLFDTAGRLAIDDALMSELAEIKSGTRPDNILLVCDAMMGQDAVATAAAFDQRLELSGFIMTKLDGDARGGAALSIKQVTGKPIKFLGMGEDLDRLEEFRPEGLASRILGMGDVVGLMKDFERVAEKDQEEDALKMLQGQFNFKDFYKQISMIQKMGPLKDILAKLPMQNMIPKDVVIDEKELVKVKAMINSMTEKERLYPQIINEGRIRRISAGSGRKVLEVRELISKFNMMKKMMGNFGKNLGFGRGMPAMGGGMPAPAGMPPGMFGPGADSPLAPRKVDRDKLRKTRKLARNARKKNRKK